MRLTKKVLILITLVVILVSGVIITENILGTTLFTQPVDFSSQSAISTVYIQNGVSGVVTLTDPSLQRTVNINIDYPLDSGSGVVVTKDGYIITAFHVVGDPINLKKNKQLKKMTDSDIKLYIEEAAVVSYIYKNPQLGKDLTGSNVDVESYQAGENSENIDKLITILNQKNLLNVSSYKQVIKVGFPSNSNSSGFKEVELVDVGDGNNDEDVAILKINADSLPALSVSSEKPKYWENIRIYGYPGKNNQTDYQNTLSSLNPSSATGYLISEVSRKEGTIYYQTNAHVSQGYSGGPVLNSQNNVIGIVIYGINSTNKYLQINNSQQSVFLSAESIIKICNKNNIQINII